ncbi:hypothetical protein BE15_27175 [Sorangium cellulosum]|uniref:Sigma-54 factor interaction domain-containing protein n=1 Tax=Sorangium cellulosum TaxID=56 RepID=A0A150QVW1_SORCE|nr:hypothetical protein BE15_27175 [Sorangium cellulosum]
MLVAGPIGVGKESLARYIHERSGRVGAFVALDCAGLTESLVEMALFGQERGALTGVARRAPGALVKAHQGTLFLDKLGELGAPAQAALLRALEDASVWEVGPSGAPRLDVRIVAATRRDVLRAVLHGEFRADLYFRVATFVVDIPPLRERPGDLAALIKKLVAEHDRGRVVRLSPAAETTLLSYAWPGNVIELCNVIERVFCVASGGELGRKELVEIAPELVTSGSPVGAGMTTLAAMHDDTSADRLSGGGTRREAVEGVDIRRSMLWRRGQRRSGAG